MMKRASPMGLCNASMQPCPPGQMCPMIITACPAPGLSQVTGTNTQALDTMAQIASQAQAATQGLANAAQSMPVGASGNIWSSPALFLVALGVVLFLK